MQPDSRPDPVGTELRTDIAQLIGMVAAIMERLDALLPLIPPPPKGSVAQEGRMVRFELHDFVTLEQLEGAYIAHVLKSLEQNKSQAATVLGIDPSTLYRKLTRLEDRNRAPE